MQKGLTKKQSQAWLRDERSTKKTVTSWLMEEASAMKTVKSLANGDRMYHDLWYNEASHEGGRSMMKCHKV